ncbi:hypothetical protein IQ276_030580 [Desmonostoc muscorum LEGE 12446]|uniref:hypothetical protein n=1 Tax=Desmonostoc muscorum TaxID=1179 RepID=UPI001F1DE91C|nr:hypothetical protein [Desmonostoc muscorum]MCF2150694.1 hypothetical protein [Desmonostoc muscorum LEGE 12446]
MFAHPTNWLNALICNFGASTCTFDALICNFGASTCNLVASTCTFDASTYIFVALACTFNASKSKNKLILFLEGVLSKNFTLLIALGLQWVH